MFSFISMYVATFITMKLTIISQSITVVEVSHQNRMPTTVTELDVIVGVDPGPWGNGTVKTE